MARAWYLCLTPTKNETLLIAMPWIKFYINLGVIILDPVFF